MPQVLCSTSQHDTMTSTGASVGHHEQMRWRGTWRQRDSQALARPVRWASVAPTMSQVRVTPQSSASFTSLHRWSTAWHGEACQQHAQQAKTCRSCLACGMGTESAVLQRVCANSGLLPGLHRCFAALVDAA